MARLFHFHFLGLGVALAAAMFATPIFLTPASAFGFAVSAVADPTRLPPDVAPLRVEASAIDPMHVRGGPAAERSASSIVMAAANIGNLSAPSGLNMRKQAAPN